MRLVALSSSFLNLIILFSICTFWESCILAKVMASIILLTGFVWPEIEDIPECSSLCCSLTPSGCTNEEPVCWNVEFIVEPDYAAVFSTYSFDYEFILILL